MIHHGDCLEILPTLPAESIDSIVTDPPYGLSFMGKNWDHGIPGVAFWSEALRAAKPGAHLLAFGGTRTFHRLTCAIEDAGWEIRDCIMWVYGSGFPKSHDVSKAIDREAGAERKVVGTIRKTPSASSQNMNEGWRRPWAEDHPKTMDITAPATTAAQKWQGWGTALKPAWEPIIVARKPLAGTVAANVQAFGTGAINVDGCRVEGTEDTSRPQGKDIRGGNWSGDGAQSELTTGGGTARWPANLIHDGSDEVLGLFPVTSSGAILDSHARTTSKTKSAYGKRTAIPENYPPSSGSAARFFYCAKASKADRDEGCEGLQWRDGSVGDRRPSGSMSQRIHADEGRPDTKARNHHPTVKATDLMRYLCRLVTQPGGTVLDPFCGSGSTGKAATLEGFEFIGIEREAEYVEIARARIAHARGDMPLLEAVR